jgi:hypothetical protein
VKEEHAPEERGSRGSSRSSRAPDRVGAAAHRDGGREGRSHRDGGREWGKSGGMRRARVWIGRQCGGLGFGLGGSTLCLGETRGIGWCVSTVQMV